MDDVVRCMMDDVLWMMCSDVRCLM
jgi:hypothetical protein